MTHAYLSFSMQEISGGAELTCAKKRTLQPAPMEAVVRASFKAEEMSGGIWLTFTQASQPESTSANGVDLASEKSSEKSSEKILQHLKGEPGLSARALAERMGIGSRAHWASQRRLLERN
jgi:hypothetical protein